MALLLFFTAFVLSGIAAYYSVIGIIAIFSAAMIPVAIMASSLEVAKLVVASWLYRYWKHIPILMKTYFTVSLLILMLITSMGIFGFLSKAHSDQSLVSGDVQSKIAVYDEKIKTAKDNIDANRRALKQMDEAVDQVMGRSTTETGADKAVAIRRAQAKERSRLLSDIAAEQKTITQLSEERAPIAAEVRKVEAEVGPIKYIAAMIYGDNPTENSLERSVRWLIILLICVFDPLAVLMLIAANLTQIKSKAWQEKTAEGDSPVSIQETVQPTVTKPEPVEDFKFLAEYETTLVYPATDTELDELAKAKEEARNKVFDEPVVVEVPYGEELEWDPKREESILDKHPYLTAGFSHFKDLTPMVAKKEPKTTIEEVSHDDMEQNKDTTNEVELPVVIETPDRTSEVDRQDVNSGFTPKPAMETVGIEKPVKKPRASKKKAKVEQITEDKSIVSQSLEDQVNNLIANDDATSLEAIYKQIVKELATKNRNKSTHWGPLKTKK